MYKREHLLGGAVTFLLVFTVYLLTMAPTVTFWDAGEFIASAYTLGIPHPPGTPLFVIIGRVVSLLPLPVHVPVAARINFLSVLCGSFCALLIYLTTVKILENWVRNSKNLPSKMVLHGGAIASALFPAFMSTVWENVTEAEVYAIATVTILLVSWLTVYMSSLQDQRKIKNILLLIIYIISLSIANHLIVLLVTPAIAIFTLIHDRKNWQYWTAVLGCFLGLYLLVMKGLDLTAIIAKIDSVETANKSLFVLTYQHLAVSLDCLFTIYKYIASIPSVFFGVLITTGSLFWAYKRKALPFFGAALGLFLLGFSIHLYLLIRSGLHPPINEGQPDSLAAFWAVINREQYGSAYGILPRQVWAMITGKAQVTTLNDLVENIKFYFLYNLPFYTKYFSWQYGNATASLIFFLVGIYGALEHFRHDKKTFFFWLTVFLVTGLILNTYMNFKLGYTQFLNKFPDQNLHEVRERDYFFIVSFAFFGVWSGIGLASIINKLRLAFALDSDKPKMAKPLFASMAGLILLSSLVPLYANYRKVDRSGNYIPPLYARNIMNSLEPNGIIFTNGDNDTFPLWYIQEVEGVRKDCRVVNLSLLQTPWYIKQMRDLEPKVPISYNDKIIDGLRAFYLDKEVNVQIGEMSLSFPKGSALYIRDIMIIDILRTNKWKKPIYFTTTVPSSNRSGLDPYLTMVGSVFRINQRKAADLAAQDTNLVYIKERDTYLDVEGTRHLIYDVYRYDTFFRKQREREDADSRLAEHFSPAFAFLGHAYLLRGDLDQAIKANEWFMKFLSDKDQFVYAMASLYARNRQYDQADSLLKDFQKRTGAASPAWYQQLAQIAVNNSDTEQSIRLLKRSLEIDPLHKEAYVNLFTVYNAASDTASAVAIIEQYLRLKPEDQAVRAELERYTASGKADFITAFGLKQ